MRNLKVRVRDIGERRVEALMSPQWAASTNSRRANSAVAVGAAGWSSVTNKAAMTSLASSASGG
ncbi:hypothetical protein U9M48_029515 [Paspalum notatum var. saurae]|uniref:Uncharacterized protein n=1 Tax=Paspalum notatum var. saurae TaxID=547442 RepID=A0AAQ3TY13_PASNO